MSKRKEMAPQLREAVVKLKNEGNSFSIVAKTLGLNKSTVQTIIRNYNTTGSYESKPRSGRPCKLDERTRRKVLRNAAENPKISAVKLANSLQEFEGIEVHAQCVRRCLKQAGLASRIARKKPFISEVNRKKRLSYAKHLENKHIDDPNFWSRVIFTDECKFNVFGRDGPARVWRKRNTALQNKNINPTVKHGGGSVMVWGCMAANGVGELRFIEGIMDRHMYLDILKTNFIGSVEKLQLSKNYVFMHDNDPKHSSGLVKEWLLYNVKSKLDHPPQSPDLNVIEHLWAYLKNKIKERSITSKSSLKAAIIDEWEKISPEVTKKLALSMPSRLKEVIKANGGPTRY